MKAFVICLVTVCLLIIGLVPWVWAGEEAENVEKTEKTGKAEARSLVKKAGEAWFAGDGGLAIKLLREAVENEPDSHGARYKLAHVLRRHADRLERDGERELKAGNIKASKTALQKADEYRQLSIEHLQKLREDTPEDTRVLRELAGVYLSRRKYALALHAYRKLLETAEMTKPEADKLEEKIT
jgi:tetratricopeptide (TPR) repeat protein